MGTKETGKLKIKPLLHGGMVVAVLAAVLFIAAKDAAATFAPTLTVAITDPTPETSSDFVSEFGIGPTDVNFAAVVAFIPPDWGVVPGDQMPIGTDVGSLDADSTLGLIGDACNQALPVHFDFKNASINREDTVSFQDTDTTDDDITADYAKDVDENGLSDAIDKYPDFLNRLFEDLQPIRRSAGIQIVAGIPVLLQFLIFEPGTVIDEQLPSVPERGFPSVTVLQNVGDPDAEPAPGAITDFCTPLATTNTTLGQNEDGVTLFVNPQAGVYNFSTVSFGQRDADGDGYENSLDTCAQVANIGNPKVKFDGDLDGDGIDAACDPNDDPTTAGNDSDEDADGYLNRQDNCPLDANGQEEDNQNDEDTDQIGDACDTDSAVANGELSFADLPAEVTIGSGGAGGPPACAADGGADGVQCWFKDYVLNPEGEGDSGPTASSDTGPTDSGDATPKPSGSTTNEDDDGGSNTGVIVGVVVAAIAAVAIIGGGIAMMRRRNGGM